MPDDYIEVERPDWPNYFIDLAFYVSQRSEDPNTQHGCVLTDKNHNIISTGYNSLARKIPAGSVSNTRPAKYKRMIHAEANALLRSHIGLWTLSAGVTAYVTAKPCIQCLDRMWNSNINEVCYAETGYHFQGWEDEKEEFADLVADTGMKVYSIEPDLRWFEKPIETIKRYRSESKA